jgi:hypothetical protein
MLLFKQAAPLNKADTRHPKAAPLLPGVVQQRNTLPTHKEVPQAQGYLPIRLFCVYIINYQ